jgi:KDO2-lipid IV(A) lauroyltransferase
MKEQDYLQQRDRLLDDCFGSNPIYADKTNRRTFNLVSANLLNFMPSIPVLEHDTLFRQIGFHQKLALLDSQHTDPLKRVSYEGPMVEIMRLIKTQPAIICTHHMGSLKLINYVLGLNHIKYSLVIGQNEVRDSGSAYEASFNHYQWDIQIISAHKPNAGSSMLKALREGRSLLVYIDGNTGTGDDSIRNTNRQKIAFLDESIYVRKGAALLASVANVPLIPVVCYRQTLDQISIRFQDPVYPDKTVTKDDFAKTVLQTLYNSFSTLLCQYPGQWECWKYLHSIINPQEFKFFAETTHQQTKPISAKLAFNTSRFGLIDIEKEYFLFNKRSYAFFPISNEIHRLLTSSLSKPEGEDLPTDNSLVKQLYQNNVLVSV